MTADLKDGNNIDTRMASSRAHTFAKAQQCIIELSSHVSNCANHLNTADSFHRDLWIILQETNKHVKAIMSENVTESEKKILDPSTVYVSFFIERCNKRFCRKTGG